MFRYKKTSAIFLCTVFSIATCLGQANKPFLKDVPVPYRGTLPYYYRNKSKVEEKMGLRSIENGFDSIQVRIWYGYGRTDSSQLVVLTKTQAGWKSIFYNFKYYIDDIKRKIDSIGIQKEFRTPKSGWQSFSSNLFGLSITTLPDNTSLRYYPDYADGSDIIIEVATKTYYRIYHYTGPHLSFGKIKQADKIESILKLINSI
jgi:hypothetical protein